MFRNLKMFVLFSVQKIKKESSHSLKNKILFKVKCLFSVLRKGTISPLLKGKLLFPVKRLLAAEITNTLASGELVGGVYLLLLLWVGRNLVRSVGICLCLYVAVHRSVRAFWWCAWPCIRGSPVSHVLGGRGGPRGSWPYSGPPTVVAITVLKQIDA